METASVGEIQKNFSGVLKRLKSGQTVMVTKRGKPVAKMTALEAKTDMEWTDFYGTCIELPGKPLGDILVEDREDRFR